MNNDKKIDLNNIKIMSDKFDESFNDTYEVPTELVTDVKKYQNVPTSPPVVSLYGAPTPKEIDPPVYHLDYPVNRSVYGSPAPREIAHSVYGAPTPREIDHPVYGAPITNPNPDINITYSQLEDNIDMLKKNIATLKKSWNDGTKKNLTTLENSWVGVDCIEYTAKLKQMDKKVQNTISALELLCSTYEQARDMLKDNQNNVLTAIKNVY